MKKKPTKYTNDTFIIKCIEVHGYEFDYSQVLYSGMNNKIYIKCNKCSNEFYQLAGNHIRGNKCFKCTIEKKRNKKSDFITNAIKIHGDKYDYSNVEYKNNCTDVKIKCKKHRCEFYQQPQSHLRGAGCPKCAKNYQYTKNEFIKRAIKVHGDAYNYSAVTFSSAKDKIKIFCNYHNGFFEQQVSAHLSGHKCHQCFGNGLYTNEELIRLFIGKHGIKYDYSLVNYKGIFEKIKIICPIHKLFEQIAKTHLGGGGCPLCNESRGEKTIASLLNKINISYERQFTFEDCKGVYKNSKRLPFDFYIPDLKICIEYDGDAHFKPVQFRGMSLERAIKSFNNTKRNDKIKTQYCKDNNIDLLRIPYTHFKKIDEILTDKLIKGINPIIKFPEVQEV